MLDVAILQLQPHKGPPENNRGLLEAAFSQIAASPPQVIVLPEAALTGYFLEGATLECARSQAAIADLLGQAWRTQSAATVEIICGFFELAEGTLYNSAIALEVSTSGVIIRHVHRKVFLPTYGVFDEARFLARGRQLQVYAGVAGRTGLAICEDLWHALVPTILALKGMQVLIVPSASPGRGIATGDVGSVTHWHTLLRLLASEHGVFVIYAGLTGFEGGKAMSGGSCVIDPFGHMLGRAPSLEPAILRATIDVGETATARAALPLVGALRAVAPDLLRDPELLRELSGSFAEYQS